MRISDWSSDVCSSDLFRLDPDPYWLQLQIADARIATVRNEIDAMRAAFRQSEAELGEAMATVRYFEREAGRQRRLAKSGPGPAARLAEAECAQSGRASRRERVWKSV